MKRFIVFTDEELDKIKAGELVVCKDCDFSDFFVVTPDGTNKGIYRYFKHSLDGVPEINENKYFYINYFRREDMMLHSEFDK